MQAMYDRFITLILSNLVIYRWLVRHVQYEVLNNVQVLYLSIFNADKMTSGLSG